MNVYEAITLCIATFTRDSADETYALIHGYSRENFD